MADDERHLDPRSLHALAHPLRLRLLGALRADGPATATQLGQRFGESSGSTSYHLRQLAEHGFIEEAPDQPSRRERWWRSVHRSTRIDVAPFLEDPGTRGAIEVLLHEIASVHLHHIGRWLSEQTTWTREWIEASTISDYRVRLTAQRLDALVGELDAVIERYRTTADDGPDAASVVIHLHAFPQETA